MTTQRTLRIITAAALAFGGLAAATTAAAQENWAFELRVDGARSTRSVGVNDPGTGFGLEGSVSRLLMPHLAAYAGWDWQRYTPGDLLGEVDMDLEETGYVVGVRWAHPFVGEDPDALGYWIRGGATIDHFEVEDAAGDIVADSGHGLGWEAGVGLTIPVADRWDVTPGVRYRSLSRDLDFAGADQTLEMASLTFGVGIRARF